MNPCQCIKPSGGECRTAEDCRRQRSCNHTFDRNEERHQKPIEICGVRIVPILIGVHKIQDNLQDKQISPSTEGAACSARRDLSFRRRANTGGSP